MQNVDDKFSEKMQAMIAEAEVDADFNAKAEDVAKKKAKQRYKLMIDDIDMGSSDDSLLYLETLMKYSEALDAEGICMKPQLHDDGNAKRLARSYSKELRYATDRQCWYYFDKRRWVRDPEARRAKRAAVASATSLEEECSGKVIWPQLWPKMVEKVRKHAIASRNLGRVKAAVELASTLPSLAITTEKFDRDPFLLNITNGSLDLKTGELRPHDRNDFCTKIVEITFDPAAQCPEFLKFLNTIMAGDQELIAFLQRAIGYTMTGDASEHSLFILYGSGRNGKTTLLNVIDLLLGDYGRNTQIETFLSRREGSLAPREDLARLEGARYVRSTEVNDNRKLDEGMVKLATGDDPISARALYQEGIQFKPQMKVWWGVNHKPLITGQDFAMWRRVKLIPFTVTIPDGEVDGALPARLRAELPGILNWALEGCLEWQRVGLSEPDSITIATAEYQNDMDTVKQWLDECAVIADGQRVKSSEAYFEYTHWSKENGMMPMSARSLKQRLLDKGFKHMHTKAGNVYTGFALGGYGEPPELECDADADQQGLFAHVQ